MAADQNTIRHVLWTSLSPVSLGMIEEPGKINAEESTRKQTRFQSLRYPGPAERGNGASSQFPVPTTAERILFRCLNSDQQFDYS